MRDEEEKEEALLVDEDPERRHNDETCAEREEEHSRFDFAWWRRLSNFSYDRRNTSVSESKEKSAEELVEEAQIAAEALRNECEIGLGRVRLLMSYMLLLSVIIMPAVGVCEWVLVESRRGNLEHDWWKCLIHDNVELHYIDSDQSEQLPGVLATMLYQSCLLAWAAVIVYQRSCIRMDWISSAIINNLYTLLLILLPAFSAAWPAPTSVTASLITMIFYIPRKHLFKQIPKPNKCDQAHQFCLICLILISLTALANIMSLIFVCRAEAIRRKAVAAEKRCKVDVHKQTKNQPSLQDHTRNPLTIQEQPRQDEKDDEISTEHSAQMAESTSALLNQVNDHIFHHPEEATRRTLSYTSENNGEPTANSSREYNYLERTEGLSHRLCCRNEKWHIPRSMIFGALMSMSYVACAVCRCIIVIISQHSFDQFTKAEDLNVSLKDEDDEEITVLGGTTLIPTAPTLALGPSAAFLAFASIVRGYSGDDLANYRIAALLAVAALFVDAPAFAATFHATIQRNLYTLNVRYCVENYVFGRADNLYGFPSRDNAHAICICLFTGFIVLAFMSFQFFFMAAAAIRTFYLNHRSFDDVVMPAPAGDQSHGSIHLLRTDDRATFEYDLNAPLLFPQRYSAAYTTVPSTTPLPTAAQPHNGGHRHTISTPQRSFLFTGLRHQYTEPRYSAIIFRPRFRHHENDGNREEAGRQRSDSVPIAPASVPRLSRTRQDHLPFPHLRRTTDSSNSLP